MNEYPDDNANSTNSSDQRSAAFAQLTMVLEDAQAAAADGQNPRLGTKACEALLRTILRKLDQADEVAIQIERTLGK